MKPLLANLLKSTLGWLVCLGTLFVWETSASAIEPVGFKPIFNGKDLTGWEGETKFWSVQDGVITAESTPENPCKKNSFLVWKQGDVDDFELKLKFKITGTPDANSGIQFRSQIADDGHLVGYQADIDRAGKWLGACYDEHGRGVLALRGEKSQVTGAKDKTSEKQADPAELLKAIDLEGWNEYHITARGNHLTLAINGQVTAEVVDNDEQNRDLSGVLALQLHSGPPMKVEFKDIQLKRLPLKDRKKIVFVAGTPSHAYFSHEHNAGCLLLADSLNQSGLPVQTAVYLNGWPKDVTAFDNADTVVCYCDGGPRHFLNPHLEEFDRVMDRGVGLVNLHYAVETVIGPEGDHFLKWVGGYFEPHWSVNPHWIAEFAELPKHPITRGVQPFSILDEWYYHMRFVKDMEGVTPILSDLPTRETLTRPDGPHSGNPYVRDAVLVRKEKQHVAWAYERENNGRGFGFTGGHFHNNWQNDNFRKVVLNAVAWTAHLDVPEQGVQSPTPTVQQMEANQDGPKPENWQFKPPVTEKPKKQETSTAPAAPQNKEGQVSAKKSEPTTDKPLFSSPVVTTKTPGHAVEVKVPIRGAKTLYLVVGDGQNGFSCDWADWAEPRLVGPDGEKKLTELRWQTASADWGQVKVNANAGGKPLRINGQAVEYGLGTHANSVIGYQLPENHTFETFQARAGLDNGGTDQSGGTASSVQFYVFDQPPSQKFLASISRQGAAGDSPNRSLEAALQQLEVGAGLEVSLFAGEPMMLNPTNIDIDARGRVWVCEVVNYRQFRNQDSAERTEGDRILILEDTDGDGQADRTKTFYQGRDIDSAHGICVLGNQAIVSAGDSIFRLIDDNGDDKADRKEVLFTGIGGVQHDHGIHAVVFGPDGKLYFNFGNEGRQIKDKNGQPIVDRQGNVVNNSRQPYQEGMVFRCNPDGSEFETLGWNFRNNWEVCVDSFGTLWQSDNDDDGNRGVRINYVMEYGNYGYRDELTGAGWREPRTDWSDEIPLRHWHQNDPGSMPNLLQTGAGSPTGILIYEGDLLPEVYRNQLIHSDAGPNIVRAYPVKPAGAGYSAESVTILEGVQDKWFRPSDVCIAPDGSLFIADWYDPGVGGHRMADVERGRIFRVAPPNSPYRVPKIDVSTIEGAITALKSPNVAARYLGWTALQKQGRDALPALTEMYRSENPRYRARALWLVGKLNLDKEDKLALIRDALQDANSDIRITALRLVRQLRTEIEPADIANVINLADASPAFRREILIGLRELDSPEMPHYWAELATQHDGQDRWYLEALGIAATGRWEACLQAWLDRVGEEWNTPAGRDILWRSRAPQTAQYLVQIIADPETPLEELPRYFRALDFNQPIDQDLLAKLAFRPSEGDQKRNDLITSEAISRIQKLDFQEHPEYAVALNRLLDAQPNSQTYLSIVSKFELKDRYPGVLQLAMTTNNPQLSVDAIRLLVQKQQTALFRAGLQQEKTEQAIRLAEVVGQAEEQGTVGPLRDVFFDPNVSLDVRRAAAQALGRTRNGRQQLLKAAQQKRVPRGLDQTIAAILHSSVEPEIKTAAQELYPLPPSKDDKPLPPLTELAQRTGNPQNGRLVFHTHGTCTKCHQINGLGKEVGPDLSEIGKKLSKLALWESILYPSAGISHNYEAYTVVTIEGNILTGLMVSQTDTEISIKNAEGLVRTIARDDIEELLKQEISLMPADLQKIMTEQELVDVVEYMTTLKEKKK